MRNATKLTVSVFGALAGISGIVHGLGEILQGNIAPDEMVILSWPESPFFDILAGEPAMTIIPNLLITGILAVVVSLIFLVWVTRYADRKHGALVLMLLSIVMLLVGAGFGPPLLGIILGVVATGINAPLTWWRSHLPVSAQRFLGALWRWSFAAALVAWLLLLTGISLFDYFVGVDNPDIVYVITLFAFGLLLLTSLTAIAYDIQRKTASPEPSLRQRAA